MTKEPLQQNHLRRLFVILPVVIFLFAACSSAPSESEGKKFLAAREEKGQDLYRVKSFTKTNGISNDRTYTMEYEAEFECLKSNEIAPGAFQGYGIQCRNAGQIVKGTGKVEFEKTENGWRAIRMESDGLKR